MVHENVNDEPLATTRPVRLRDPFNLEVITLQLPWNQTWSCLGCLIGKHLVSPGVMHDQSFPNLQITRSDIMQATHKVGCQSGDRIWSLMFLRGLRENV